MSSTLLDQIMFIDKSFAKLYEIKMNSNVLLIKQNIYLQIIMREELFSHEKYYLLDSERKTKRLFNLVIKFTLKQSFIRS